MHLIFETERLMIQPLEIKDHAFILKLVNTAAWINNIGDRKVNSSEDAKTYIQKILNNPKYYCNTFKLKNNEQPIGIITVIYRETQKFPDIGYAMLPEHEGKGFAYEAVKSYLGRLEEAKISDQIIAITLPQNNRSIALLERLGFTKTNNFVEENAEIFIRSLL